MPPAYSACAGGGNPGVRAARKYSSVAAKARLNAPPRRERMMPTLLFRHALLAALLVTPTALPAVSADALDALVRAAHAAGQFDGVVLVARGDDVRYRRAIGSADRITQQAHVTGETWRWMAITQQVTAALVMQDVQNGRLRLDDTLATLLPDFGDASLARINVRQLLQHSAGLANPDDGAADTSGVPLFYRAEGAAASPKATLRYCGGAPKSAPGAKFEDNPCDYIVLGAVLERLNHASYAQLVATRIARPLKLASLGMQSSARAELSGRVVGYRAEGLREAPFNVGRYGAAGALSGSLDDLRRFDSALLDGSLLSQPTTAAMWSGDPKLGNVAFGALAYTARLPRCAVPVGLIERRSEIGGVHAVNVLAPAQRIALIAFSNTAATEFGHVMQGSGLLHDLLDATVCEPDPPAAPSKRATRRKH